MDGGKKKVYSLEISTLSSGTMSTHILCPSNLAIAVRTVLLSVRLNRDNTYGTHWTFHLAHKDVGKTFKIKKGGCHINLGYSTEKNSYLFGS